MDLSFMQHVEAMQAHVLPRLYCSLCSNMFDDPHCFPGCSHAFCRSCALAHLKSFSSIQEPPTCPSCHAPVSNGPLIHVPQIADVVSRVRGLAAMLQAATAAAAAPSSAAPQQLSAATALAAGSAPAPAAVAPQQQASPAKKSAPASHVAHLTIDHPINSQYEQPTTSPTLCQGPRRKKLLNSFPQPQLRQCEQPSVPTPGHTSQLAAAGQDPTLEARMLEWVQLHMQTESLRVPLPPSEVLLQELLAYAQPQANRPQDLVCHQQELPQLQLLYAEVESAIVAALGSNGEGGKGNISGDGQIVIGHNDARGEAHKEGSMGAGLSAPAMPVASSRRVSGVAGSVTPPAVQKGAALGGDRVCEGMHGSTGLGCIGLARKQGMGGTPQGKGCQAQVQEEVMQGGERGSLERGSPEGLLRPHASERGPGMGAAGHEAEACHLTKYASLSGQDILGAGQGVAPQKQGDADLTRACAADGNVPSPPTAEHNTAAGAVSAKVRERALGNNRNRGALANKAGGGAAKGGWLSNTGCFVSHQASGGPASSKGEGRAALVKGVCHTGLAGLLLASGYTSTQACGAGAVSKAASARSSSYASKHTNSLHPLMTSRSPVQQQQPSSTSIIHSGSIAHSNKHCPPQQQEQHQAPQLTEQPTPTMHRAVHGGAAALCDSSLEDGASPSPLPARTRQPLKQSRQPLNQRIACTAGPASDATIARVACEKMLSQDKIHSAPQQQQELKDLDEQGWEEQAQRGWQQQSKQQHGDGSKPKRRWLVPAPAALSPPRHQEQVRHPDLAASLHPPQLQQQQQQQQLEPASNSPGLDGQQQPAGVSAMCAAGDGLVGRGNEDGPDEMLDDDMDAHRESANNRGRKRGFAVEQNEMLEGAGILQLGKRLRVLGAAGVDRVDSIVTGYDPETNKHVLTRGQEVFMLDLQQDVWLTPNTAYHELAAEVAIAGDAGRRSSRRIGAHQDQTGGLGAKGGMKETGRGKTGKQQQQQQQGQGCVSGKKQPHISKKLQHARQKQKQEQAEQQLQLQGPAQSLVEEQQVQAKGEHCHQGRGAQCQQQQQQQQQQQLHDQQRDQGQPVQEPQAQGHQPQHQPDQGQQHPQQQAQDHEGEIQQQRPAPAAAGRHGRGGRLTGMQGKAGRADALKRKRKADAVDGHQQSAAGGVGCDRLAVAADQHQASAGVQAALGGEDVERDGQPEAGHRDMRSAGQELADQGASKEGGKRCEQQAQPKQRQVPEDGGRKRLGRQRQGGSFSREQLCQQQHMEQQQHGQHCRQIKDQKQGRHGVAKAKPPSKKHFSEASVPIQVLLAPPTAYAQQQDLSSNSSGGDGHPTAAATTPSHAPAAAEPGTGSKIFETKLPAASRRRAAAATGGRKKQGVATGTGSAGAAGTPAHSGSNAALKGCDQKQAAAAAATESVGNKQAGTSTPAAGDPGSHHRGGKGSGSVTKQHSSGSSILHPARLSPSKPVYLVLTYLSDDLSARLKAFCKQLPHAHIHTEFKLETSHVVVGCEEGAEGAARARRRSRALYGILCGCYVLSHAWAEASMAAGTWVEEGPYLLQGGPQRVRQCMLRGESLELLKGYRFHLDRSATSKGPSELGSKQVQLVQELLQKGGATRVERPDRTTGMDQHNDEQGHQQTLVIVADHATPSAVDNAKKRWGVPLTSYSWVIDCVAEFSIQPTPR